MWQVAFTPENIETARRLAWARHAPKEPHGFREQKMASAPGLYLHFLGVKGEAALAHLLKAPLRQVAGPGKREGGYALIHPQTGQTIAIRHPRVARGRFLMPGTDRATFTADLGVLVWSDDPEDEQALVTVAGYFTRADWCAPPPAGARVIQLTNRHGQPLPPSLEYPTQKLRPFGELMAGVLQPA